MPKTRIKISSTDVGQLNEICNSIKDIAERAGVNIKGPMPLPTKRLKIATRKTPCGSGRETYDHWEVRIHKRMIEMGVDERALRLIMRIPIPKDINVEMEVID